MIVAEIGVNFHDLNEAKEMIWRAKKSNCDAVKFQLFNEEVIKDSPLFEKLKPLILSKSDLKELKEVADEEEIDIFASCMYEQAIDILVELDCKYIKFRHADSNKEEWIKKALNTDKTVFVSADIHPVYDLQYHPNIKFLYCVAKYPSLLSDLKMDMILWDGYSNHYPSIVPSLYAVSLGAEIIEVHVTLNKQDDYLDNPVSLNFNQLNDLVKYIKIIEQLRPPKEEALMF